MKNQFRKKPVVIEAWCFTGEQSLHHIDRPKWFCDALVSDTIKVHPDHLVIPTMEGNHRADLGDWIIQGVKGEMYPCKPEIFSLTYEPVDG